MGVMIIGIVSGYFNPVHFGHIEYIQGAKALCDYLIVVVNNDYQVTLKGSKKFMDEDHRCKIMFQIKGVDDVFKAGDRDKTVCESLRIIRKQFPTHPMKFFNGGDRAIKENIVTAEENVCKELGIKFVLIPSVKRYSSSTLLAQ
jgi:cytidyltransferase-like protein